MNDKLTQIHKILLAVFAIGIGGALVIWALSGSSRTELQKLEKDVKKLEDRMKSSQLPQNPQRLLGIISQLNKRQKTLDEWRKEGFDAYQKKIENSVPASGWDNLQGFMKGQPQVVTNELYYTEYVRIIRESPFGDLEGAPDVLGMTDKGNSQVPLAYQVAQLWTIEKLLALAKTNHVWLDSEFRVETQESGGGRRGRGNHNNGGNRNRWVRCLMAFPPQLYTYAPRQGSSANREKDQRNPVLLELRFRIGVVGSLQNIKKFTTELTRQESLFGVTAFLLTRKEPPQNTRGRIGDVRLYFECVTYFPVD